MLKRILIVDDSVTNLKYSQEILKDTYRLALAKSGELALHFVENNTPDLILLDVNMPVMDGFETYQRLLDNPTTQQIPVIFLTAETDPECEIKGFSMGAMDFLKKPLEPEIIKFRISRILEFVDLKNNLQMQVEMKTRDAEKITLQSVLAIANIIDSKTVFTKGHAIRVAQYAEEIARRLGMSEAEAENIKYVGLLHDIGKIGISDALLSKPGKLSDEEFEIIKKHSEIGADILRDLSMVRFASEGAKYHHERYDGNGYPTGKSGENIPLAARIITVADSFDAMNSLRSYRPRLSIDDIKVELVRERGRQFDPQVSDIMLDIINDGIFFDESTYKSEDEGRAFESGNFISKVLYEYTKGVRLDSARDSLTGLWNRSYIEDAINIYTNDENSGPAYLLMLDLDNFKTINDQFGHLAGDAALKSFGNVINKHTGENGVAARVGGDEFMLFLKDIDSIETCKGVASKIVSEVDVTLSGIFENSSLRGVSIGIAGYPDNGLDYTELYRNSDRALYYVKQNGRNGYHVYNDGESVLEKSDISKSTKTDLEDLKSMISEQNPARGAILVDYDGFKDIYKFISRELFRTKQNAQLLLMTLDFNDKNSFVGADEMQTAMDRLENAIRISLRRGDVSARFSSTQFIVILPDSNIDNGRMAARRILDYFERTNTSRRIKAAFDIEQIERGEKTDS